MEFQHYSVMLNECIEGLAIRPDGLYVDCTCGGGGHSLRIAQRLDPDKGGRLIAIDQDSDAIEATAKRLADYLDRVTLVKDNFSNVASILDGRKPDGVLIDLGLSSYEIDCPERGFSYIHDAPLDMRMDRDKALSAKEIVNTWSEEKIADVLFEYGEEKFSRRIASNIVRARADKPIGTTLELVSIIRASIPAKFVEKGSHVAKRSFQGLRIAVNNEIEIIPPTIRALTDVLAPHGRLVILTFHSLEDRAVKTTFNEEAKGCICPPDLPVCVCGRKARLKVLTKKPLLPSPEELAENSRSHSAKLRIAEKIAEEDTKN